MGFELDGGLPYNLSSYSGISIQIESAQNVWMALKMPLGTSPETYGYFGGWIYATAGVTGVHSALIAFTSTSLLPSASTPVGAKLDLTKITDIQFTVGTPSKAFAFAVHSVNLVQ
jgi:hypothetical protein